MCCLQRSGAVRWLLRFRRRAAQLSNPGRRSICLGQSAVTHDRSRRLAPPPITVHQLDSLRQDVDNAPAIESGRDGCRLCPVIPDTISIPGATVRRLVLIAIALLLVLPFLQIPSPGLAQVDASTYLPPSDQLPSGFELIPNGEQNLSGPQVVAVIREYRRLNPEVAPDDETRLIIGVESTASLVRGIDV